MESYKNTPLKSQRAEKYCRNKKQGQQIENSNEYGRY